MDNHNYMYLCIYRQISRLVHSNLLIVRLLPSSEHCTMSVELSKSGYTVFLHALYRVSVGAIPCLFAGLYPALAGRDFAANVLRLGLGMIYMRLDALAVAT